MSTLQIDVGTYWLNTVFFNTEAWWQSKTINVLNHYQPSVLSLSLKSAIFYFHRYQNIHPHFLHFHEFYPQTAVISDVDPSLATVVFGLLHSKLLSFYFQWKKKSRKFESLWPRLVYILQWNLIFFFFPFTFFLPNRSWEFVQLQAPPDDILSLSSWPQG